MRASELGSVIFRDVSPHHPQARIPEICRRCHARSAVILGEQVGVLAVHKRGSGSTRATCVQARDGLPGRRRLAA